MLITKKDITDNKDNITVISSGWTLDKMIVIGLGLNNKGLINLKIGSAATLNISDANIWPYISQTNRNSSPNP